MPSRCMPSFVELYSRFRSLRNLRDLHNVEGTWDQSEYLRGMANGLILAVATMEESSPEYRDRPESYPGENRELEEEYFSRSDS